jgi:hypothetical protein
MPKIPAELTGREEIRAWGDRVPVFVDYLVQSTHPGTIQLQGDAASGRAYLCELIHLRDGNSELNYAIYHDMPASTPTSGRPGLVELSDACPRYSVDGL